jgi:amino acid transporter
MTRNLGLALVFVMFTYGGWNDLSFVAAEVRKPERNLVRALLLGTGTITLIYLAVNGAYLQLLGIDAVRTSSAVAADAVSARIGPRGAMLISALVCISCLGAINGMILTGARIHYAAGRDHRLLHWLGQWHPRLGTPARSLLLQGVVTLAVVMVVGLKGGGSGFERLVTFTAPLFWLFILLVIAAVPMLRWKDRNNVRVFRVPLYPLPPILFGLACLWMLQSSGVYAWSQFSADAYWMLAILASGIALSFVPGDWRPGNG